MLPLLVRTRAPHEAATLNHLPLARPRMRAALPLLFALALPGCVDLSGLGLGTDEEPAVLARTGYLDSAMLLSEGKENDTSAVRVGSFFQAWADGADYPTWEAPPTARDVLIDALHVTLYVRPTGPVLETARFPDVMVYGGAGGSWIGFGSVQTQSVLLPGEIHELEVDLEAPEGGLWVPAGSSLGIKVVPVMHQNDAADIEILVGGEAASQATWEERVTTALAPALVSGTDAGEVVGSAYAGDATPESAHHRVEINYQGEPQVLLAWMNVTSNEGIPDIDLGLTGPDGEPIAFSGTPTPREFIRLRAENLAGPGVYTLTATSYGSARAQVEMQWLVG